MLQCKRSNILIQLFEYFESKQHWQWPVGTDPGIEKRSFIESAHLSIRIWRQCWTPTPRWAILWTIWNLPGHLSSDLDILVWTRNLAAWWQEVFDLLLPLWRCFKWYCGTKVWHEQRTLGRNLWDAVSPELHTSEGAPLSMQNLSKALKASHNGWTIKD